MKSIFIILLTFLFCNNLMKAQDSENLKMSKVNIYAEASTLILFNSISGNLEVKMGSSKSEKINFYCRGGIGRRNIISGWVDTSISTIGLAGLTMLTGKDKHHFEVSVGIITEISTSTKEDTGLFSDKRSSHNLMYLLSI
ncbi:hypothetical protein OAF63_02935 [Saprospiraceae bacterium]|jgi:hypothetical protein|nr:hypothetical protein [Saprospiraceae bacterium]